MLSRLAFTISTLVLSSLPLGVLAAYAEPSVSMVVIDRTMYFPTSDGPDIVVPPGTYDVEHKDSQLQLRSAPEKEPLIVAADKTTHDEQVIMPLALVVTGESEDVHLFLLLPDKTAWSAVGSYSGVRSRGPLITQQSKTVTLSTVLPSPASVGTSLAVPSSNLSLPTPIYTEGPSGGTGGKSFADNPVLVKGNYIRYMQIRYGPSIDSIEIGYSDPPIPVKFGGSAGQKVARYIFKPGEYITEVSGSHTNVLQSLKLVTNLHTILAADGVQATPAGTGPIQGFGFPGGIGSAMNLPTPVPFNYLAPPGYEIIAFHGRQSLLIDSLGVTMRARPQN